LPVPPELPPLASTAAILVAAGDSSRMGRIDGRRKPLVRLGGLSVLEHAGAAFGAVAAVERIVVAAHREDLEEIRELVSASSALAKVTAVVEGGATRTDSVRLGVEAAGAGCELVAIHDAARPLIRPRTILAAIEVAGRRGAALVAIPATDTVKETVDGGGHAARTLDRSRLWFAQTPQVFRREELRRLLARAREEGFSPTDDAALYERYVGPIPLVRGEATNLKLTTREDLAVAEALLRARDERPEVSP